MKTTIAARAGSALLPLLLTPVLGWLLAEGYVNLGGGEKDILLAVPWAGWSFIFLVSALVSWHRQVPLARSLRHAALVATGLLALVLGALFVWTLAA